MRAASNLAGPFLLFALLFAECAWGAANAPRPTVQVPRVATPRVMVPHRVSPPRVTLHRVAPPHRVALPARVTLLKGPSDRQRVIQVYRDSLKTPRVNNNYGTRTMVQKQLQGTLNAPKQRILDQRRAAADLQARKTG